MAISRWPLAVRKESEQMIRNFLWTGKASNKKMITVAWDKVFKPMCKGGLGLKRFKDINRSMHGDEIGLGHPHRRLHLG
ncbi:hypothetical protein IFM89_011310 [Coptis chinensis]|uniref:Uncharacterized protein n=1 Tax=Coptis chinensis TaxID=261450 RepID=A0A835LR15_9MAGN|nr:hypothetical protein IFM89_011310 [Coptis chinensis]